MNISSNKHIKSGHMSSPKKSMTKEKELPDKFVSGHNKGDCDFDLELTRLRKMVSLNHKCSQHLFEGKNKLSTVCSLDLDGYMIPANIGRISHMCLTCGMLSNAKSNYLEVVKTFLAKMPDAKFTILTDTVEDARMLMNSVDEWAKDNIIKKPERVNISNTESSLSMWAQDSTLVVGNNVIEQDRKGFPCSGDQGVAAKLARDHRELDYERMEGIFIDGGNQLATKDTIFVGSDAVNFMIEDMKAYPSKYNKIESKLNVASTKSITKGKLCKLMMEKTFPHQKIVVVGNKGVQPAFHIDMAMTPLGKVDPETGKKVITVGDPSMALKILGDMIEKEPKKYAKYQNTIKKKLGSYYSPLDTLVANLQDDKDLQKNFDSLAKDLEKKGYKIERVPYLGSSSLSKVPWITYNNAVIDGDNIFIPNFDIPELDKPANSVYKKYGYKPVPIDMTAISSLHGAINCVTKVIEREYSPSKS